MPEKVDCSGLMCRDPLRFPPTALADETPESNRQPSSSARDSPHRGEPGVRFPFPASLSFLSTMRVALISGSGCVGKTTLAKRYRRQAHLLLMDIVVRDAAHRACPYLREFGTVEAWFACPELWGMLDRFSDTWTVVRHVVELNLRKAAAPFEAVVAEGVQLRTAFWKLRLLAALPRVDAVRSYWVTNPPEQIQQQALHRGFDWTEPDIRLQWERVEGTREVEFDLTGPPEELRPDLDRFLLGADDLGVAAKPAAA